MFTHTSIHFTSAFAMFNSKFGGGYNVLEKAGLLNAFERSNENIQFKQTVFDISDEFLEFNYLALNGVRLTIDDDVHQ